MPRFDDIDIFDGPALDAMGVPITGSSRDMHLQMAESIIRDRYVDPLQAKAKDALKMKVSEALESVPGITGSAIAKVVAMADSSDPDDKRIFNQLVSKLNLPFDVRRTGDDYRVSKRFQDVLGDNSNVGVSAYLPDEGDNQYRIEASKRFPDFLGGEASVSANMSTEGGPEIRANFVKRFAEGGSAGDIDIFGYNLGGSVGQMMGRRPEIEVPDLSPAQMANIGAAFADPLGLIDITGEFPEFPAGDVSISGMVMEGPRSPSLAENLREGNYGSAVLQGIGVVPVVGGAMRAARGLGKAADRLERAKKAGFDTDTVYYHGADADITEFRMPSRETGETKSVGTGVFMSSSPDVAGSYTKTDNSVIYPVYINKSEFIKVRPANSGEPWSSISKEGMLVEFPDGTVKPASEVFDFGPKSKVKGEKLQEYLNQTTTTDDLARRARKAGYKGLIIENVVDASVGSAGLYRNEAKYLKEQGYDVNPALINQSDAAREAYRDIPVEIRREARNRAKEALYQPSDIVVSLDPSNIRSVNAEFDPKQKKSANILKANGGEIRKFSKGGIADLILKGAFDPRFDPRVKEQDMLRNLEAEIVERADTQPMPGISLSELEGEDFVTSMSDRTRAGADVRSINRIELIDPIYLPGGQGFMFNNPSAVWASGQKPSSDILKMARELKSKSGKDPLYIPWRMAPSGGDFATTTGELMLGYAAANMTKATRKALDKAIGAYRTKGSMVKGKRVGAGRKIEGWKGIDDPSSVQVWRNTPDAVRKELMNMMDVEFRNKGGLSIGAARLINADPAQLVGRDAGIQNVGRIFADIDIFESDHPAYPFNVPGAGVGVLRGAEKATIFDLLPDAKLGKAQKKVKDPSKPTDNENRALQMKPYGGTITEKILRRMEARGVDINSIAGLSGGALTFTLIAGGLVTPQEAEAGVIKEFAERMVKADQMGLSTDQILYHGSTFDIEKFVPSPNTDNDFGTGTYLTISPSDASRNYAGEGPDLTNRINTLSESIQESLEGDWGFNADFWDKINDPEVFAKIENLVDEFEENRDRGVLEKAANLAAKTILKGQNEGVIYPVFVNNNDFAVIGGKNKTVIDLDREQYYDSAREELDRSNFDSDDDFEDAVFEYAEELENNDYESPVASLADTLRYAGASDEAVAEAIDSVLEGGAIDLTEINDIIRRSSSEDFDTGEMLNNGQIMQNVLTDLGYKGVVDNTTGAKFANMGSGGMHTIVFPGNENLIRSINAKFDPENADSPNILASAPPILAPFVGGAALAMGSVQDARAAQLAAEAAGAEVFMDAASGIVGPIAGGVAGLVEYLNPYSDREGKGERIKRYREGVGEALNYEPRSELGKDMSQSAMEGIAGLLRPAVQAVAPTARQFADYATNPDNVMDDYGLNVIPALYQGGKYIYEDIFGEPEREAVKSAIDVAL